MLTYGTAVAEIVPTIGGDDIGALYVADLDNIDLMHDDKTLSVDIYVKDSFGERKPIPYPDFDFNDSAESASWQCTWCFDSRGLPFVSEVLLKFTNLLV